jgi:transcriptional regulator with XRE-family HTH domain
MTTKSDAIKFLEDLDGPLSFGDMVASLRQSDQISQSALAEKLGISPQNLSDIEKGRKGVSLKKAAEFAKAMGYSEVLFVEKALQEELNRDGFNYQVHLESLTA